MNTSFTMAINILYVLVACNVIFLVVVYIKKIKEVKNQQASDRFQKKYKDYLLYIQAHSQGDERLRVPNIPMNEGERLILQDRINDLIESFTGVQRQKLIVLCKDLGFTQYHLTRLNGRSYSAKVDAAYHLGCMRAGEAVEPLLKMLRNHKLDSSLFVIARAVAKCARDEQDVKQMVRILLQHEKGFHDLLVDIIQEADIDQFAVFAQFVEEEHPTLIKIGLTGLKDYSKPSVASAAYRLIDHENGEIQLKAVEVYLNSSHLLPKNVIKKLLGHANAEIRLLTIGALSAFRNESYVSALKESLQDTDKRVVYASAIALINLGQDGMATLCSVAAETIGKEQGTFIQQIIEDELKKLSTQLHDLDKLTRYNALLYSYEKTFGKYKRIYRVV
ncbi:HEAT repeat domain-containing protein [Brevibacillus ruminantium]|uniref:HEAT repeat domain-containing protein n=1 Tax=Brevibacillus ruminantium TaxID=2950604 RepID=A0ABY4WCB4_9BACL|nr:HEAT repeat domain-containing protein [Brevibacillus ruminantium]USG64379.1 HEAT repeat domain-containing protein [Brevibacillus ruminantium]